MGSERGPTRLGPAEARGVGAKREGDLVLGEARPWTAEAPQDIVIGRGAIEAILPAGGGRPGVRRLAADGRLVLPGLVNVHAHLDKALLAGRIPNASGTIGEARRRMKEAKAAFTAADVRERAGRVLRRSLQHGVTALRTHVDIDPAVGLTSVEALLALREELAGAIDLQLVAFPQEGIDEQPGTEDLMREALRLGVDVVGGHLSIAADLGALRRQTDIVFRLAKAFDRDVDVHVDFDIDRDYGRTVSTHADGRRYPDGLGAVSLAEKTIAEGYQGRVTASHLCGLDAVPPELRRNVIDLLRRAGVSVVALPSNNMYVHGREDATGTRRGVTRLRELQAGGVRVAVGPDNIRDPFDPFGNTDLIQNAVLASLACHLVTPEDFWTMLGLHTWTAAEIMRLPSYGLAPGCQADLVVFEARGLDDLLDGDTARTWVLKRGRIVAATEMAHRLELPGACDPASIPASTPTT
jgi:cytosine deaminase